MLLQEKINNVLSVSIKKSNVKLVVALNEPNWCWKINYDSSQSIYFYVNAMFQEIKQTATNDQYSLKVDWLQTNID